jgi:hypothetical protein
MNNVEYIDSLQEETVLSNVGRTVKDWKEEPVSEDLERAADKEASDMWDKMEGEYDIAHDYFIAGANWMKAQLLAGDAIKEVKGSFGGEIKVDLYAKLDNGGYIDFDPSMKLNPACGVKIGNRVRIIVMED